MPWKSSPTSEASIAKRLSAGLGIKVTRKMVQSWKAKGYDLDDIPALKKSIKNQERLPKGFREAESKATPPKAKPKPEPPTSAPAQLIVENVERELARLKDELLICNDYDSARTLNTKITGVKNVLKELREQRHYIRITESINAATAAAVASKAAWEGLEDELPPRLEGKTAAQMKKELRDYARLKATELSEVFGKAV